MVHIKTCPRARSRCKGLEELKMVHIKTHTGVRLHFNADGVCCHHSRMVTVTECPTGEVLLLRRLPKGRNAICTIHGSQLVPSQCAPLVGPGHIALDLPRELPAPSRRATIARMPTHAPALLSVPSRHATTARAPTHASDPLPALGRCTTTARAPAHARVPLPVPGRPASTGPRTATITPGMRTRRPVPDHYRALHNVPSPRASKEGTGPSRTSGMAKLLSHAQTAALSLRGRRQRSPPPRPFAHGRGSCSCPDEKRSPKRKAPHDEELSDRDHKRHRGTEEVLPLLKCRIIVNEKRGGIFFATHLQNVDRPIHADGVFYVHNPERRVWKQIGPNVAPVLATEDDRKQ
ncbi:hypothetical protein B0H14DRAFT_2569724 [Mycena olivaceomarginata]|nr:hypothetical protein B0H14DRAFT_2569724 [Mycena olivaceomarginata]